MTFLAFSEGMKVVTLSRQRKIALANQAALLSDRWPYSFASLIMHKPPQASQPTPAVDRNSKLH
jgi:hypothetical protein